MSDSGIIILGATPFSSLMRCYLENGGTDNVVAYSVEAKYISTREFDGLPLVPLEKLPEIYPATQYHLLNTVGYVQMNGVRERLFHQCKALGYSFASFIHPSAIVNSSLGEGCIVLEKCIVGYRNRVGCGCIFYGGVNISHDCHVGDFTYWGPGAIACGNVTVGARSFIGAGAVLRNRIHIANKCLVGGGVYMNRSLEKPDTVIRAPYPEEDNRNSLEIF